MENKKINKAVEILENSGIIIYPTETVYGLGCDATNEKAINKIYKVKKRNKDKPLSIITADKKMTQEYCKLNKKAKKLMEKYMPGPLTLIVKKKNNLPDNLSKETIAFRISSSKIATKITKKLKKPTVATSANVSGEKPANKINDINKEIINRVNYILDIGKLPENKPSTIYDTVNKKILRKGDIELG